MIKWWRVRVLAGLWTSAVAFLIVFGSLLVFTFERFATMQVEGLPTLAGALFAVMVAFTSLMYNRARAFKEGSATNNLSLQAAEGGLKSTLTFIAGAAVATAFYGLLRAFGYTQVGSLSELHTFIPIVVSVGPLALFTKSFYAATLAVMQLANSTWDAPTDIEIERRRVVKEKAERLRQQDMEDGS